MSTIRRLLSFSRPGFLSFILFLAAELVGLRCACPTLPRRRRRALRHRLVAEALGNQRARIRVAEKADAVWVHLPWRRHDRNPENKQILIVDAATRETIDNVARAVVNREAADLVFQPATVPGEYYVYFAPFTVTPGSGGYSGDYLPPKATAAPEWLQRHGLTLDKIAQGDWQKLPRAKVLEFQARGQFERFDPMEVVATQEEMKKLLADHPQPYLVFPEDRKYPIRMNDELPLRWIHSGPGARTARPGRPQRVLRLPDRRLCRQAARGRDRPGFRRPPLAPGRRDSGRAAMLHQPQRQRLSRTTDASAGLRAAREGPGAVVRGRYSARRCARRV